MGLVAVSPEQHPAAERVAAGSAVTGGRSGRVLLRDAAGWRLEAAGLAGMCCFRPLLPAASGRLVLLLTAGCGQGRGINLPGQRCPA